VFLGDPPCLIKFDEKESQWVGPVIWFGLFYECGKDTHAGFEKSSELGIEDCIESDGIYTK
jgi:hypothetical protein